MQLLQIDVGIRLVPQFLQDPLLYILGIMLHGILVFLQVFLLILAYFGIYLSSVRGLRPPDKEISEDASKTL
jgi:hypothetical protein